MATRDPPPFGHVHIEIAVEEQSALMIYLPGEPQIRLIAKDFWHADVGFERRPGGVTIAGETWPAMFVEQIDDWQRFTMQRLDAAHFLAWLHGTGLFECEQAEGELFTRWRWSEPLKPHFVDALLVARMRESRDG
jgi:hypothetical protein